MFGAKRKPDRAQPQQTERKPARSASPIGRSLKRRPQPQVISSTVIKYAFGSQTRKGRHWKEKSTMATLLSRIFGKKTVEPAPVRIGGDKPAGTWCYLPKPQRDHFSFL